MKKDKIDGARVRERRETLNLSQRDVASRITRAGFGDLSYQAIQQLEEGWTRRPRYAMYLAPALETSWEYLTGQTNNPARPDSVNASAINSAPNDKAPTEKGIGQQEGPQVLMEISRMLGQVEGSLKTTFNTRFDAIDRKLDNHESRLEALEERLSSGPRTGRRR